MTPYVMLYICSTQIISGLVTFKIKGLNCSYSITQCTCTCFFKASVTFETGFTELRNTTVWITKHHRFAGYFEQYWFRIRVILRYNRNYQVQERERRPQNWKKISHLFWQNSCFYSVVSKQVGDYFQIFVAFSENLNFKGQ